MRANKEKAESDAVRAAGALGRVAVGWMGAPMAEVRVMAGPLVARHAVAE